ncbi:hypothetical protein [Paraburkholderia fungorum]|uniref:hypothetical protein n=1 Tax=Paraburkholderia fungorum TaxID=134537 RepID=UPI002096CEBC|nr:hypothetical protein [Paraburkholderia fungorum]USX10511.1 hypothetical protein NHH62_28215 [Paraburkholderia fungorum]
MQLQMNQLAFLRDLAVSRVRYVAIGGMAMQAHGIERETIDLDLLIDRTDANARLVREVLGRAVGRDPQIIPLWRLTTENQKTELWPIAAIDVLTSIDGMIFDSVYARRSVVELDGLEVSVMGTADLILAKEISSRSGNDEVAHARDRADIDLLRQLITD